MTLNDACNDLAAQTDTRHTLHGSKQNAAACDENFQPANYLQNHSVATFGTNTAA